MSLMRFVVYGAGAIGGVVGARLHQHGMDVQLVARGPHLEVMRREGLVIRDPETTAIVRVRAADPAEIAIELGTVVLLTVKTHQTAAALDRLSAIAPPSTPIVCLQNGVENERLALRRFGDVVGASVMCPTVHLQPGVVQAHASPTTGVIDVGRYPTGVGETATGVAAALNAAGFDSVVRSEIMRWKYAKLLANLGNALEAVCGPAARRGHIAELAQEEGRRCLEAARIDAAAPDEPHRTAKIKPKPIDGVARPGGSSWQSLERGVGTVETDYLNGEIVMLGRLHGVPTPVNEQLQVLCDRFARDGVKPGALSEEGFLAALADGGF